MYGLLVHCILLQRSALSRVTVHIALNRIPPYPTTSYIQLTDSPGKERLASPFILICLSDLSFRLISAFTSLSLAYFMVILEARESGEWEWTPVMEVSMSCKS